MHLLALRKPGVWSRALHLSTGDHYPVEFRIDEVGRHVDAVWSRPDESPLNLDTLLLGPALRCVLGLRGVTCIHAAVVAARGGAVAIAGPKGAGKSTLTAALARAGHPVLADDLAVIDERPDGFWAHSGPPRVGLWPDALAALGEDPSSWPWVLTTSDKRWRGLAAHDGASAWRHEPSAQRLAAICLLADDDDVGPSPTVDPLPRPEALVRLLEHATAAYASVPRPGMPAMERLIRLVGRVPVLEVRRRRRFDALPALAEAIAGAAPVAR